ncbi:aromatic acid exporter family protein [Cohnella sp. REN36]|uniref:aromatic acid exporter family protein n=1 Tax=Cohnella sp. REN36 TaxID=2887347 RepID=UPI001D147BC3|nr:aromatic acid exporter family protein [Cohnella sp. REN36]MCC3374762.1 aromatic acid exporter family protein [Cohnella sp. REN36]
MKIGARVFKTGLAVAISLWVGELVGLQSPLIAAIAAIVMIQPSIYRSWVQVLQQLQSNLIGACMALLAVWLFGSSPLAIGLVAILVILLCIRLKAEETIGLTVVTVVVLMEAHGLGWPLIWDRLAALLTGIVSSFVVNIAIAPPRHRSRFLNFVQDAQSQLSRLLRTSVSNELKEKVFKDELSALRAQLRKLDGFYDLFAEERVLRRKSRVHRARLLVVYKAMLAALERGVTLVDAVEEYYFPAAPEGSWSRLVDRQIETLCSYHEQLLWKWEGKLKSHASAAAPPPEGTILLTELINEGAADPVARTRLLTVAAAIFAYEDRLRRLDKLTEQWLDRQEGPESEA